MLLETHETTKNTLDQIATSTDPELTAAVVELYKSKLNVMLSTARLITPPIGMSIGAKNPLPTLLDSFTKAYQKLESKAIQSKIRP